MFDVKNLTYILTMLEAIEKIFIYSNDFEDEEDFYHANKQLNFNASVNLLIAIGEENINWKNISALRDKISHNYRGIDEYIVWDIIQNYLPKLKIALIKMIPKIEDYKIYLKEALNSEYYEDLKYLEKLIKD